MKNKLKAFGCGLAETIFATGGIALAVWDFIMIPKLTGFIAVVVFIGAIISLLIGLAAIMRIGYGRIAIFTIKELSDKFDEFKNKREEVKADGKQK